MLAFLSEPISRVEQKAARSNYTVAACSSVYATLRFSPLSPFIYSSKYFMITNSYYEVSPGALLLSSSCYSLLLFLRPNFTVSLFHKSQQLNVCYTPVNSMLVTAGKICKSERQKHIFTIVRRDVPVVLNDQ